jgi:hypothetical protein
MTAPKKMTGSEINLFFWLFEGFYNGTLTGTIPTVPDKWYPRDENVGTNTTSKRIWAVLCTDASGADTINITGAQSGTISIPAAGKIGCVYETTISGGYTTITDVTLTSSSIIKFALVSDNGINDLSPNATWLQQAMGPPGYSHNFSPKVVTQEPLGSIHGHIKNTYNTGINHNITFNHLQLLNRYDRITDVDKIYAILAVYHDKIVADINSSILDDDSLARVFIGAKPIIHNEDAGEIEDLLIPSREYSLSMKPFTS